MVRIPRPWRTKLAEEKSIWEDEKDSTHAILRVIQQRLYYSLSIHPKVKSREAEHVIIQDDRTRVCFA